MRKQLLGMFGAALLVGFGLHAQGQQRLIADVPFDFTAGSSLFQAGQYNIEWGPIPAVVALRSADGRAAAMILANAVEARKLPGTAKLVFHRYGNDYFLAEVWKLGDSVGRRIPPGAREREMAQTLTPPTERTVLARVAGR